jgi:hypothetical protein
MRPCSAAFLDSSIMCSVRQRFPMCTIALCVPASRSARAAKQTAQPPVCLCLDLQCC